jgi:hypothetical protein
MNNSFFSLGLSNKKVIQSRQTFLSRPLFVIVVNVWQIYHESKKIQVMVQLEVAAAAYNHIEFVHFQIC